MFDIKGFASSTFSNITELHIKKYLQVFNFAKRIRPNCNYSVSLKLGLNVWRVFLIFLISYQINVEMRTKQVSSSLCKAHVTLATIYIRDLDMDIQVDLVICER